jgi:hypothetical protein
MPKGRARFPRAEPPNGFIVAHSRPSMATVRSQIRAVIEQYLEAEGKDDVGMRKQLRKLEGLDNA